MSFLKDKTSILKLIYSSVMKLYQHDHGTHSMGFPSFNRCQGLQIVFSVTDLLRLG